MILSEKLFKEFNEEFDRDWFYTYQALKNVGSVQDYSEEFEFEDEAINFAKDHDYEKVVKYYYPIIDNSEETWDFIDYVNYGHPKYNEEIWNRADSLIEAKGLTKEIAVLQGNYGYGWDDLIEYELDDMSRKQDLKDYDENEKGVPHRIIHRRVLRELIEDIEKTKSGKWVNRGKEGTHGEFKTKKAAREQQKAMFARGFKESIKPTNAEKIYDKLQKDLNKLGYRIGLNRRTGDIQINQRVFKENGKYKSGTITTKEALKDAIDLANEYGLKTSVEVFLHKPILTIHTTKLFDTEVTREALNNNLKVKDESLYQTDSVSGNKMTFEIKDDGTFIVRDGDKVVLDTKVVDVDKTKEQIASMQDIEILQENVDDDEVTKQVEMIFSSADKTFPHRMLDRLKSDFKYILGAVKDNAEKENESLSLDIINKHLWFHDIDKQAALMKAIYERLEEKPEDLTVQDIDNFVTETKQLLNEKKAIKEDLESEQKTEEPIDPSIGLQLIVNNLINDENEAIDGYNSAIVNFEVENKGELTEIFREIIKDEQNHIGNLQKILNELNPDTIENIQAGQEEAAEILDSDIAE